MIHAILDYINNNRGRSLFIGVIVGLFAAILGWAWSNGDIGRPNYRSPSHKHAAPHAAPPAPRPLTKEETPDNAHPDS